VTDYNSMYYVMMIVYGTGGNATGRKSLLVTVELGRIIQIYSVIPISFYLVELDSNEYIIIHVIM